MVFIYTVEKPCYAVAVVAPKVWPNANALTILVQLGNFQAHQHLSLDIGVSDPIAAHTGHSDNVRFSQFLSEEVMNLRGLSPQCFGMEKIREVKGIAENGPT